MTQEEILTKLTEDIRIRGLTEHTVKEYYLRANAFLQYSGKLVEQLGEAEIRIFLKYLLEERRLSPSSVNGYNSALCFLFEVTLERNLNYKHIPRAKEPILLPNVMTVPEIQAFFSVIEKSRDRAIFLNIYGSGLRLGEICRIRVQDIDSKQMRLFIRQSKGKRDRFAVLSQARLDALHNLRVIICFSIPYSKLTQSIVAIDLTVTGIPKYNNYKQFKLWFIRIVWRIKMKRSACMLPQYLAEKKGSFTFEISLHEFTVSVPPHGHAFLELHYVIEGQGIEKINGFQHTLKPGTFAVIFPYQVHEIQVQPASKVVLYNLCLSAKTLFEQDEFSLCLNKLLFDIDLNDKMIYDIDVATSQKFLSILCEINSEFTEDKVCKKLMLKAKITEFFVLFDRYRRNLIFKADDNIQDIKRIDMWCIIHYVYINWNKEITLKNLSERFYLSETYISTIFKQCLGINFHVFLTNLRIENACSLLYSSKIPIIDVAYEVGYSSYSTFVRVFNARKGVSPSIYRQKVSAI